MGMRGHKDGKGDNLEKGIEEMGQGGMGNGWI